MCRVKAKLREMLQRDEDFSKEDLEMLNPLDKISIGNALRYIRNPVKCCRQVHRLIQELNRMIPHLQEDNENKQVLYHSETWDLMARRWGKLEKDFCAKDKFDISKIPDIYDCAKYDVHKPRGEVRAPAGDGDGLARGGWDLGEPNAAEPCNCT